MQLKQNGTPNKNFLVSGTQSTLLGELCQNVITYLASSTVASTIILIYQASHAAIKMAYDLWVKGAKFCFELDC